MPFVYYLVNITLKDIMETSKVSLKQTLREAILIREWSMSHDIELVTEQHMNPRWLVETQGYSIDMKYW
jgi:hypothetical protein